MRRFIRKSKQKGLAAIEFVMMTPLLIVFMTICLELGNLLVEYQALNKAVRNGARYAVTAIYGTATTQQIAPTAEIQNVVVYGANVASGTAVLDGLLTENVSVSHNNDLVTVTASFDYVPTFATLPFLENDMSLNFSASAVMETGL
ncbi:TadE/TadG family type IV pilus assembly protein [Vibrio maritimus]